MEKPLFKVVSKCCKSVTNKKNGSVTLNFFGLYLARPRRVELLTSRSVVWRKIPCRNKTEELQEI